MSSRNLKLWLMQQNIQQIDFEVARISALTSEYPLPWSPEVIFILCSVSGGKFNEYVYLPAIRKQ